MLPPRTAIKYSPHRRSGNLTSGLAGVVIEETRSTPGLQRRCPEPTLAGEGRGDGFIGPLTAPPHRGRSLPRPYRRNPIRRVSAACSLGPTPGPCEPAERRHSTNGQASSASSPTTTAKPLARKNSLGCRNNPPAAPTSATLAARRKYASKLKRTTRVTPHQYTPKTTSCTKTFLAKSAGLPQPPDIATAKHRINPSCCQRCRTYPATNPAATATRAVTNRPANTALPMALAAGTYKSRPAGRPSPRAFLAVGQMRAKRNCKRVRPSSTPVPASPSQNASR